MYVLPKLELNFQSRGCKLSFGHIHVFLKFHTLLQNFIEWKRRKRNKGKIKCWFAASMLLLHKWMFVWRGHQWMGLHFCVPRTICNVFGGDPATIDCLWTNFFLAFMMTTNVFLSSRCEYTLCSYKTYRNSSSFNASKKSIVKLI